MTHDNSATTLSATSASHADLAALEAKLAHVSDRAASWLLARIDADGRPRGADVMNTWWRVPWALSVAGHRSAAAQLLSWAERDALEPSGALRAGPYGGDQARTTIYQLSHLLIAAHQLSHHDMAAKLFDQLMSQRNPKTGGAWLLDASDDDEQDWLMTTQIGLVAVMLGALDVADQTYSWLKAVWDAQPESDSPQLYPNWADGALITDASGPGAGARLVKFDEPLNQYFQPGAAAAFLADYALARRNSEPLELARELMQLNLRGSSEFQFDDPRTVQICKFGWGAAQLMNADPAGGWLEHTVRMATWFEGRQEDDGSWSPSTYSLSGPATDSDKMWKTAEHLMEVEMIRSALGSASRPDPWSV